MSNNEVSLTAETIASFRQDFANLQQEIGKVIVGYQNIVEDILIAFFAGGHVLLEGLPGLGKTMLARTMAEALDIQFSRIQFTPDLMPADIIGTNLIVELANQRHFQFQRGPVFAHLVLADEINRASPKTQSALLECMQERSITVAGQMYRLEDPFFLLATQNPIEMTGTYPLPEAQLDRFFFKLSLLYPSREQLNAIVNRTTENSLAPVRQVLGRDSVALWQKRVRQVYVAPHVQDYACRLVLATHPESGYEPDIVRRSVRYGASPRAAQTMVLAGKIKAMVAGRCHVSLADVYSSAKSALRHRIILRLEAEADGISSDSLIEEVLQKTPADATI